MTPLVMPPLPPEPGPARLLAWPRVKLLLIVAPTWGLFLSLNSDSAGTTWQLRSLLVAFLAVLAYGLFERWPAKLPAWLARWVLQLLGVIAVVPLGALLAYWVTTGEFFFWRANAPRLTGWLQITYMGILFGPWIALASMLRQREAFARHQALAFELERSELERRALDARLRLLQSQVEPHFLFNTLANVRTLVKNGSPQASSVLDSLITYLRAAIPRLNEPQTTLGHEVDLVHAYLRLMQMRMPDRLQYTLEIDEDALPLKCPPMTLLTLVENAVRHGIDPSEAGGRIEIGVRLRDGRCRLRVVDTGVGLRGEGQGTGTGLSTLRERLALAFGADAHLHLTANEPHGACAEIDFPAARSTP